MQTLVFGPCLRKFKVSFGVNRRFVETLVWCPVVDVITWCLYVWTEVTSRQTGQSEDRWASLGGFFDAELFEICQERCMKCSLGDCCQSRLL